jgi:hypothetical protein
MSRISAEMCAGLLVGFTGNDKLPIKTLLVAA